MIESTSVLFLCFPALNTSHNSTNCGVPCSVGLLRRRIGKTKKHLGGSTQATIHLLAIILTAALWVLVSMIAYRCLQQEAKSTNLIFPVANLYIHSMKQNIQIYMG